MTPTTFLSRAEMAARGQRLVHALGGAWRGDRGLCRCPTHADRTPSLSVRLGHEALLFKCFAGCDTGTLLRVLHAMDPTVLSARADAAVKPVRSAWLQGRIRDLWREAQPIAGTPANLYLAGRGIEVGSPALRYHARVPVRRRGALSFRPAMLAAVCCGRRLLALQRTFLDPVRNDPSGDFANSRWKLGQPGRGAVMLGAAGSVLGLAEGIETGLSAMQLLGIPIWATLGTARFDRVQIPPSVTHLVLLPDCDPAGSAALARAMRGYACDGRVIEPRFPPAPAKDWNDVLQALVAAPPAATL